MTSEEKKAFLLAAIDFGSGAVSDYPFGADGLYIKYKNELCLHIWWWEGGYYHNCYLKKEDATIDCYSLYIRFGILSMRLSMANIKIKKVCGK